MRLAIINALPISTSILQIKKKSECHEIATLLLTVSHMGHTLISLRRIACKKAKQFVTVSFAFSIKRKKEKKAPEKGVSTIRKE